VRQFERRKGFCPEQARHREKRKRVAPRVKEEGNPRDKVWEAKCLFNVMLWD